MNKVEHPYGNVYRCEDGRVWIEWSDGTVDHYEGNRLVRSEWPEGQVLYYNTEGEHVRTEWPDETPTTSAK